MLVLCFLTLSEVSLTVATSSLSPPPSHLLPTATFSLQSSLQFQIPPATSSSVLPQNPLHHLLSHIGSPAPTGKAWQLRLSSLQHFISNARHLCPKKTKCTAGSKSTFQLHQSFIIVLPHTCARQQSK